MSFDSERSFDINTAIPKPPKGKCSSNSDISDGRQSSTVSKPSDPNYEDAFVVFVDHTECFWLKWLRSGFRHCFVVIRRDGRWVICDSLKNYMDIYAFDLPYDFDLASHYVMQGHIVLVGTIPAYKPSRYRLGEFLTCVNVTKRLLRLDSLWIWTPWQLFKALIRKPSHHGAWRVAKSQSLTAQEVST